jgi:hypothetical protein
MSDKKQQKGPKAAKSGKPGERATSAAFDTWLERKLHEMFDSVTAEPIPDDLLKVIAELDKQTTDKK